MKEKYRDSMDHTAVGRGIYRATRYVKNRIKRTLLPTTIFENMGLTYLGPVDGHDLEALIPLLRTARDLKSPVLIHIVTQKGKGYKFAEEDPSKFHGVGKFDTGSGLSTKSGTPVFSDAFGDALTQLANADNRVCAITAAMPAGTGLLGFKATHPKRLFDVGIAEEHAVSMAGGLAKQGMVPVVALYSTFLQRSFDQIMQDIAMLKLHVVLAIDRAGLVGEDGETHHGVFDIGILRQAPGMKILAPGSCQELKQMLSWAVTEQDGPVAIRYPRGGDRGYTDSSWEVSHGVTCHRQGKDVTLVTHGVLLESVMDAAQQLSQQGVEATVLRLLTLWPLPTEEIASQIAPGRPVAILEETAAGAGIREALAWELRNIGGPVHGRDLGNEYIPHGNPNALYQQCGLDGQGICNFVQEVLHEG